MVLAGACLLWLSCTSVPELPKMFPVPAAQLTSSSGEPFGLDSLRGNVVVYDFIFTRCGGTCPVMSSSMKKLTRSIDPSLPVRFVSITVDPEHDSPEVLKAFRARLGADDRWIFLTGGTGQIVRLSTEGFKLAAANGSRPGGEALLHSAKLVLADKEGMIRGYYDGVSGQGVDKLMVDIKSLSRG